MPRMVNVPSTKCLLTLSACEQRAAAYVAKIEIFPSYQD